MNIFLCDGGNFNIPLDFFFYTTVIRNITSLGWRQFTELQISDLAIMFALFKL